MDIFCFARFTDSTSLRSIFCAETASTDYQAPNAVVRVGCGATYPREGEPTGSYLELVGEGHLI